MKNVGLIILMLAISTHMIASKEVNDSLLNVLIRLFKIDQHILTLDQKKFNLLKIRKQRLRI